jgi:hypothetical protein
MTKKKKHCGKIKARLRQLTPTLKGSAGGRQGVGKGRPVGNKTSKMGFLVTFTTYSCKNGYNADPADPSPTPRRPPKGRRLFVNNTNDSKLLIGVKFSMPTPF